MKPLVHKAATQRHRSAPRGNERRLVTQYPRRQILTLALGAAALPGIGRAARAQSYPTRPITMVVPFAAGGASDIIARSLAERMRVTLNQPIIIENVSGATGSIGVGRVARAAPDGYTLCVGQLATHVMNGATYKLRYDVLNDFEPVALISTSPFLLLSNKAMPTDDLEAHGLAEGQSRQSIDGSRRCGQPGADNRHPLSEGNRHPV